VNLAGLDTSTTVATVCVLRDDGAAFEHVPEPAALQRPPAHARDLMPALAAMLERAGLGYGDLDAVAVGVGPGGFTGLRIGIAAARAVAGACGAELRPVSSLAALAAGIPAAARLAVVDAKRGQVFAALASDGDAGWGPLVATPAELVALLGDRSARAADQTGETSLAAGDGSLRYRSILEQAGVEVAPDDSDVHLVRALHVCRIALAGTAAAPETVVPDYLREPDAKLST
jgi:tRNA threonylcarbamoyladenosine biosynthesis protein TsaB